MMFPLLTRALDGATRPVSIFFRDDDAGWDNTSLISLCDVFVSRSPLDLAAIPVEVDEELASTLLSHPADLRFHQHGYAHLNHQTTGKKCEFSDERSIDEIFNDLSLGRERMLSLFGQRLDPIFTPPWNRCGTKLAESLPSVGIKVLSRDRGATRFDVSNLTELPVNIDWTRHADNIDDALASRVAEPTLGVMLHHATLTAKDFTQLDGLLDLLLTHRNAHLAAMADVAGIGVSP